MSAEQEFKCVFCSDTFSQKEDLQIHFRKHGDPNFHQKKPRRRSQDEAKASAEKSKDQPELVECDVCTEVFTTISKAITHKHKVHPDHDTKYFCPWCGKLFTMKHLYNKHMSSSHPNVDKNGDNLFHCDTCNVDFHVPAAMANHNKFYHRQDELPTLGHTKKIKMILEEIVNIYYCPFCGEEFDNKVNLNKHMNDDHRSENQNPVDVFRCPLCDAIFYYLDAYELHLMYHSVEDIYTHRNEKKIEITDFSLETVQPMQEKVENADLLQAVDTDALGIEALLEFTMDDATNNRKSKKHKKHKKSKKAAITLDEFLNMNKDVFGEGIDFQGIEEVPTQVVTKRLKAKRAVPASKLMSSDIAKLKKQGIVVKKQATKAVKSAAIKRQVKGQKNTIPLSKINTLTSTDDVLTKLLHQGSQIKVVKKTNPDMEDHSQQKQNEEYRLHTNQEINNENSNNLPSAIPESTNEHNTEINNDNIESNNIPLNVSTLKNPSSTHTKTESKVLESSVIESNNCSKFDDSYVNDNHNQFSDYSDLGENLNALRNNSNIEMKSTKPNVSENSEAVNSYDNQDNETVDKAQLKKNFTPDEIVTPSEHSSLNALKRLSSLITVKPLNSVQHSPVSNDKKLVDSSQKVDAVKSSQNNSSKTSDVTNFTNLKSLSGITIKSTSQSNKNMVKKSPLLETEDEPEINNDTDDEGDEDERLQNKNNNGKISHVLKSPQHTVLTKPTQKEYPKLTSYNDNSQSSTDLLKHLKNVTAKPVNTTTLTTATSKCSPSSVKKDIIPKKVVQKEITADGTEIYSIDDSDSDETHCNKSVKSAIKPEIKTEMLKCNDVLKNMNKNITIKSTNQQNKIVKQNTEPHLNKAFEDDDDDWSDHCDAETNVNSPYTKLNNQNQKQTAINNVLKNLSKNITVKSRNSSPSQFIPSQDHNSRNSHMETNDTDSDSDCSPGKVKITEMENSDDEFPKDSAESEIQNMNVKVQHPDDSHSEHEDEPMDEDFEDIEAQITAATVEKNISKNNANVKSSNSNTLQSSSTIIVKQEPSQQSEEIPQFAKNLSNQISIKHVKRPENNKIIKNEQLASQSMNQPAINKKMSTSNQVNTFNKEVKTVKTFQTQTKTVIQEITTTVTKTIKTVNQTQKQEIRNMAQSSSAPVTQKVQGLNSTFSPRNYQGVRVRQSAPPVRPKIRGQAPQTVRPAAAGGSPQTPRLAICAPPQPARPTISANVRASNQVVPVRPTLNRPSGPRPRLPQVLNMKASTSGQQRPQMCRPVKVSPSAVFSSSKRPAETPGHFSCFKKPKESLIPVPDFSLGSTNDGESSVQFSSAMQMSKSNFTSTTKTVKGNSVVTSTQTKSEMSASSQQLSKLRNMSGLSVVKTSQNQAKQNRVEESSEMSSSERNTLEAIQKLQSQGLLVKKPRMNESEGSDHSQPGSDEFTHDSGDECD